MRNILDKIAKDGIAYILDESEGAAFMIEGERATVKYKDRKPYTALTFSPLVYEAMLGGKLITKAEFDAY